MTFTPGIASFEQTSDVLVLGTVTFLDEEHPEVLELGLEQSMSVQQDIGGRRTTQALGPNPKDVTWSGHLWDQNVQQRLAALKAMQVAAAPVTLSYLDQRYLVIVKTFTPKYHHQWYAEYEISVSIVADTSGQYNQGSNPSTQEQINGMTQAAATEINKLIAADSVGTAGIQSTFNILFAAIEAAGVIF